MTTVCCRPWLGDNDEIPAELLAALKVIQLELEELQLIKPMPGLEQLLFRVSAAQSWTAVDNDWLAVAAGLRTIHGQLTISKSLEKPALQRLWTHMSNFEDVLSDSTQGSTGSVLSRLAQLRKWVVNWGTKQGSSGTALVQAARAAAEGLPGSNHQLFDDFIPLECEREWLTQQWTVQRTVNASIAVVRMLQRQLHLQNSHGLHQEMLHNVMELQLLQTCVIRDQLVAATHKCLRMKSVAIWDLAKTFGKVKERAQLQQIGAELDRMYGRHLPSSYIKEILTKLYEVAAGCVSEGKADDCGRVCDAAIGMLDLSRTLCQLDLHRYRIIFMISLFKLYEATQVVELEIDNPTSINLQSAISALYHTSYGKEISSDDWEILLIAMDSAAQAMSEEEYVNLKEIVTSSRDSLTTLCAAEADAQAQSELCTHQLAHSLMANIGAYAKAAARHLRREAREDGILSLHRIIQLIQHASLHDFPSAEVASTLTQIGEHIICLSVRPSSGVHSQVIATFA